MKLLASFAVGVLASIIAYRDYHVANNAVHSVLPCGFIEVGMGIIGGAAAYTVLCILERKGRS